MASESPASPPPEFQWAKVSGPDALRPLDRHWIRYLRIALLAAAVLIAWRVLAWQEDGYREAAELANLTPVPAAVVAGPSASASNPVAAAAGVATPDAVPVIVISPTPTPSPTPLATPTPSPTPTPLAHRVRPGDTLSEIADLYAVSVDALLSLNQIADRDALVAGQVLRLPPDATVPEVRPKPRTYTVQPGDTLSAVAVRFGVSLSDLLAENELSNPNSIFVGQELRIPGGTT